MRAWRWIRSTSTSAPPRARRAPRAPPGRRRVPRRRPSRSSAKPTSSLPSPTVAVVCGASVTSSVPSSVAGDLQDHADDALADLGGRAMHVGAAVGMQHHARGAEVVEAFRVADVLEPDREADAAADALAARRVAGAAGQPDRVPWELLRLAGPGSPPRRGSPPPRAASPSITWPVGRSRRARSRSAAAARSGRSRAPRPAGPSAPPPQSTSARRRSRASRRTAGCSCRRPWPRSARCRPVGPDRERGGVRGDGGGARRIGAAVEQDPHATLTRRPSRVARCSHQIRAGWRWTWPVNDSSRL